MVLSIKADLSSKCMRCQLKMELKEQETSITTNAKYILMRCPKCETETKNWIELSLVKKTAYVGTPNPGDIPT